MSRTVARSALVAAVFSWLTIALCSPWVLSDSNQFLKDFINHELLSFLGVLVTITLGSAAHLHLSLNQLEERASEAGLDTTGLAPARQSLRQSSFWLVGTLVAAIALVVAKPLVMQHQPEHETAAALLNGFGVLLLLYSVLILTDLTQMAFLIPAHKKK